MLSLIMAIASTSFAFDTRGNISFGTILQQGQKPKICFSGGGDFNIVKKDSAGFEAFAVVTYIYSDRDFLNYKEIEAVKTMATATKTFGFLTPKLNFLYVGTGYGFYNFPNANGNNYSQSAYNFELGVKTPGFRAFMGCDFMPIKDANDMFYPHLGAMINF